MHNEQNQGKQMEYREKDSEPVKLNMKMLGIAYPITKITKAHPAQRGVWSLHLLYGIKEEAGVLESWVSGTDWDWMVALWFA